jgi:ferric-dicitrate binding protein FerR (iron transport regulator)
MDEQKAQQLLERYHNGTITKDELAQLEQWYANLDKTQEPFFRPGADTEAHLQHLLHNIHQGIAQQHSTEEASDAADVVEMRKQPPGLRWMAAAIILITLTAGALLWYRTSQDRPAAVAQTIAAPAGEMRSVVLPDSSTIWLAGGAQVQYLEDYGKHTRTVTLQKGKVFFEVKKDPAHPFIVATGSIATKVLGTSFTVDIENDRQPIVAVATGKVAVSLGSKTLSVLPPGKKLQVNPVTGSFTVSDQPVALVNAWAQQELTLAGVDFTGLAQAFETFYNVRIQAGSKEIQQNKYTIILKRTVAPEKVLQVISSLYHNQYRMMPDGSYKIY